jgi:rod shape-determining protein MreC
MKKGFLAKFVSIAVLLVVFYFIWPLPFFWFSKNVILPTIEVLSDAVYRAASPIRVLIEINRLDQINKNLESENNALRSELAKAKFESYLCEEIKKEKDASSAAGFEVISARVIGRTSYGVNQSMILDKGSADGVKEGAAVISQGYLLGRIVTVDQRKSELRLIFSHLSRIPAMIESNHESGLVQGGLEGLTLNDISVKAKISPGDKVETSGLGGDLPPGILIGTVSEVLGIKGGLFQSAKIESQIKPTSIEVVSIIK